MVATGDDDYESSDVEDSEAEDVYEEEPGMFDVPRKWSWRDTAMLTTGLAHNLAGSFAMWFGNLTAQIGAHDAYKRQHVEFADDVMNDIRRL